jgi:FdhD protein
LRVLKISKDGRNFVDDAVVEDVLFRVYVNNHLVASMNVMREKLEELTYGYLLTSGYIREVDEVKNVFFDGNDVHVELTHDLDPETIKQLYREKLSEAVSTPVHFVVKESSVILTSSLVRTIMNELNQRGNTFMQTGGTHSALIYQGNRVVAFSEDVGRFNALDKVIGEALMNKIDLRNVILATSGRLAGEMVLKASNAKVPVMCSVSAPITSGVNIAKASGMTLIGFARQDRFNVYSGFERVA